MQSVADGGPEIDIRWFEQPPPDGSDVQKKHKEVYLTMNTGIRTFLILAILAAAVSPVGAEEDTGWKFAGADSNSSERYFYRPDSVMRTAKDVIGFKMMVIHKDASKSWSDSEINCNFKIMRDLRTKTERFNKPPLFNNFPSAWRAFYLESFDDTKLHSPEAELYRVLCR